jgi:hypothetical protein
MKETKTTTLGDVLRTCFEFGSEQFLYLPFDEVWNLESRCVVVDQSDIDGAPHLATENGLSCALQIAAVQGIVFNAMEQVTTIDANLLLKAFLYYYDNDAFISLPS